MSTTEQVLKDNLKDLMANQRWLERSYTICPPLDLDHLTDEGYDAFEALISRYARTVDILINKVYRGMDSIELVEQGTMIDILNRLQKRGIIDSPEQLRELKDLRNRVAHEYAPDIYVKFFGIILNHVPLLLSLTERSKAYCQTNIFQKL